MILFASCGLSSQLTAQAISGSVRNGTTSQPASGDDVILLRLGNGMEEQSRAKTDAQGAFTFSQAKPNEQYVARVIHQGVNYDQPVTGPEQMTIQVYDVVGAVPGLTGTMGIVQVESDGKVLKVTEMYAIRNESSPPVTQNGAHNFEVSLPQKAVLDSAQARRASGLWVNTQPAPVSGGQRLYSVDFPLRPGDTLFKLVYHLPSGGRTSLHLRVPYPIRKFAIMHPPSISFKSARPGTFKSPGMAGGLKVEEAASEPVTGEVPEFEVAGAGVAPQIVAGPNPAQRPMPAPPQGSSPLGAVTLPPGSLPNGSSSGGSSAGGAMPGGAGAQGPAQSAGPQRTVPPAEPKPGSGLLALAIAVLLAGGALVFWRVRGLPRVPRAGAKQASSSGPPLLGALKEELFQLEVDHAAGAISSDEYTAARQALNLTLQRAMSKGAGGS